MTQKCYAGWRIVGLGLVCASLLGGGVVESRGQTARKAPSRMGVEPIRSMRDRTVGPVLPHKKSYEFQVSKNDWVDTGVDVVAGEVLKATASGEFALGDGRETGPEGVARGWKDLLRIFPLNSAPAGALIGRVSDAAAGVPFLVGAGGEVAMPTSGRLFLRVNASDDLAGEGKFKVKLHLEPAGTEPAGAERAGTQTERAGTGAEPAKGEDGSGDRSGARSGDRSGTASGEEAKTKAAAEAKVSAPLEPVSQLVGPATFAEIPRRVSDKQGHPGDMVNYALVGTKAQVEAAFKAAGWVAVDQTVQDAVLHGILATLGHEAYTAVPMSTLYLFGRPQELSFARGDPLKVAAERHHLRVWKTAMMVGGEPLWVGSATHDIGFETDQRNGDTTHQIDPKIDDERDFLLKSFDATGAFRSAAYVTPTDPLRTAKTATGGEFYSDGRVLVMALQ